MLKDLNGTLDTLSPDTCPSHHTNTTKLDLLFFPVESQNPGAILDSSHMSHAAH